jgi:hypothetical protein
MISTDGSVNEVFGIWTEYLGTTRVRRRFGDGLRTGLRVVLRSVEDRRLRSLSRSSRRLLRSFSS